tara:strand:- start:47070 stop:47435 length:366 start_codon:yes stop_codon:yes gene_type:complete
MHDPGHQPQGEQHAGAGQAQGAGQVQQREGQVDGVTAEPEHAIGDQHPRRPMGHGGGTVGGQLQQGGQHQRHAGQGQRRRQRLAAGQGGQGPAQGLVQAVADQQAAEMQQGRRHADLGMVR